MKYWLLLLAAAVCEILFVFEMKLSQGFTRLWHSIACLAITTAGIFLLSITIKKIPVAVAYAIWTGLGIVGTTILDYFVFGETLSSGKILCILLILLGGIGIRFV